VKTAWHSMNVGRTKWPKLNDTTSHLNGIEHPYF